MSISGELILGGAAVLALLIFPHPLRVAGAFFYALEQAAIVTRELLFSGIAQIASAWWLRLKSELARPLEEGGY